MLTEADIAIKSPNDGLPPFEYDNILGMRLTAPLKADGNFSYDILEKRRAAAGCGRAAAAIDPLDASLARFCALAMIADPLFAVRDRVIVVTGGGGKLGGQFARALLARGAKVAVFDAADAATGARPLCRSGREGAACAATRSMSRAAQSIRRGAALVSRPNGACRTGLINAAAIDAPPDAPPEENGPFETYPAASFDRIMAVNVKGTMLCCQAIGEAMAKAGRGSIVNICSIYGLVSPDQSLYDYRRERGETFFKPVDLFRLEIRDPQSHALSCHLLGEAGRAREHADARRRVRQSGARVPRGLCAPHADGPHGARRRNERRR